jgi:hypothetical protein
MRVHGCGRRHLETTQQQRDKRMKTKREKPVRYIDPSGQVKRHLIRFFKAVHPFRDALWHEEFNLVVTKEDWRRGKRGNPTCCALAVTGRRQLNMKPGDPGIVILHTIAYVALPDPLSPTKWKVLRYYLANTSHRAWDEGAKQESMTVRLKAPSISRTLQERRVQCAAYNSKARKRKPHTKSPHQVQLHVLPRGYENWWLSRSGNDAAAAVA